MVAATIPGGVPSTTATEAVRSYRKAGLLLLSVVLVLVKGLYAGGAWRLGAGPGDRRPGGTRWAATGKSFPVPALDLEEEEREASEAAAALTAAAGSAEGPA